jgi:hypothetical protein
MRRRLLLVVAHFVNHWARIFFRLSRGQFRSSHRTLSHSLRSRQQKRSEEEATGVWSLSSLPYFELFLSSLFFLLFSISPFHSKTTANKKEENERKEQKKEQKK